MNSEPQMQLHHAAKRRRVAGMCACLLVGVAALIAYYIWSSSNDRIPTDSALRERFARQGIALGQLREMITSERELRAIGHDYIEGAATGPYWRKWKGWVSESDDRSGSTRSLEDCLNAVGLEGNRFQKYLALLDSVDAERVSWNKSPQSFGYVEVIMKSVGLAVSGQQKSFVYFEGGAPSYRVVVDQTDQPLKGKHDSATHF